MRVLLIVENFGSDFVLFNYDAVPNEPSRVFQLCQQEIELCVDLALLTVKSSQC
jgi:hypothetical protein